MDVNARLEAVEAENELLREQVARLERALIGDKRMPYQLGLTSSEAIVCGILYTRTFATKDTIMAGLYRNLGKEEADPKIADVFVHKIRKKVKKFGIEILTRWGQGYEMQAEAKKIIAVMIEGEPEVAA